MAVICNTPRLQLREFGDEDAEALLAWRGDAEVMRFSLRGAQTVQDIRDQFLASCLERYSRDGVGLWGVIRKSDGRLIGECGISVQSIDDAQEFEIGYRLCRDAWGQGLASEAARACRDHGFEALGLERLISIIEAQNAASIGVARKLGMALQRRTTFYAIPVSVYGITVSTWRSMKSGS